MSDREFSDIENFQNSGKGIPLFMIGHKNCLQADYLLGPGPRLIKKKSLPGRGLTKVEKHCCRATKERVRAGQCFVSWGGQRLKRGGYEWGSTCQIRSSLC
jgi:hypothetical protein